MDSRVAWATPPRVPDVGEGRMNAFSSTANRDIRVLSPRIEPPERADDGSTASTATFQPWPVRLTPSWSMNVDLPTPGTPLIPPRGARAPPRGVPAAAPCPPRPPPRPRRPPPPRRPRPPPPPPRAPARGGGPPGPRGGCRHPPPPAGPPPARPRRGRARRPVCA